MDTHRAPELPRLLATLSGRELSPEGFAAVVSPSISVVYPALVGHLVGLLRAGGARRVLPVASGIPAFASACAQSIRCRGPGVHILSACPAAVDCIASQFPGLVGLVLDIPSPMALSAAAALSLGGIPQGTAVAISSCSLKKREEGRVPFDLHVVAAGRLFDSLAELGFRLEDYPEASFDSGAAAVPAQGCAIPDLVDDELRALGLRPVSVLKLEGADRARKILEGLSARADRTGGYVVVELSFCENGCIREPDLASMPPG